MPSNGWTKIRVSQFSPNPSKLAINMNASETEPSRKSLIKFFINKFESIPAERWCVGKLQNDEDRRCALGHTMHGRLQPISAGWGAAMAETIQLASLFPARVAFINNGSDSRYQQPDPKSRILAALHDLLAKEIGL